MGSNYEFLSNEAKIGINRKLASYLAGILSYAQLLIIPVEQDIDSHYEALIAKLDTDDPLYKLEKSYHEKTRDYLTKGIEAKSEISDFDTYIIVKLQLSADELDLLKEAFAYIIKDPINAVNSWFSLDTRDILQGKIKEYQMLAEAWLEQQQEIMEMMPATQEETQWLLRRGAYRGLPESQLQMWYEDQDGECAWGPQVKETGEVIRPEKRVINLFDGDITPKSRYLEVETEVGTSYQSFLVMSHFPDEIQNPGKEWIYQLQRRNIKPEICIHFEIINTERALKKVGGKQLEIDSQVTHVAEAGARIPGDLKEGIKNGLRLEQELKNNRAPIIVTTTQFCIASRSLADMQSRATRLQKFFKTWFFRVERPVADQTRMYFNFIPSVSNMVKGYAMELTPLAASSGIYSATHAIGDTRGPYVGTTAKGMKKVFLYLALACLQNKSAAASFIGNLGVGKSYNANLLVVIHILMGAMGLILDPKGERSHWPEKLGVLKGHINLITISATKENQGVLDAFNIYPDDYEAATELIVNVCLELCKIQYGSKQYIALKEAAAQLKDDERKPCMHTLTLILEEWKENDDCYSAAQQLARLIKAERNIGMGQLLYGYGEEKTISLQDRLNIIQIQNMKMPDKDKVKAAYTSEEVISTVVMMVLAQFAKKFALQNNNLLIKIFQIILLDESWMLQKTEQGKDLYSFLSRMGRSLYTSTIFNGHSVLDIEDVGVRNAITYRFCFQTSNDDEAKRMLHYLGMEESAINIQMLKNLGNGECMFRDADGRVDRLKFDVIYKDFHDVFDTTPKERKQEKNAGLLTKEAV